MGRNIIKTCISCTHHRIEHDSYGISYNSCNHVLVSRLNPVTGERDDRRVGCSRARDDDSGLCGYEGRYWEPKKGDVDDD